MQYPAIRFSRFLSELRTKGFIPAAKHTVDFIYRRTVVSFTESRFDRKWGVETIERVTHPQDSANPLHLSAEPYEATPLKTLHQIMRSMAGIGPSQFAFFDMGCGKGRALIVAADCSFKRVVGVEFCPHLAKIAEDNVQRPQFKNGLETKIEIVCMDAAHYEFPDEDAVIFFGNPFNEEIMSNVLKNIRASARTSKNRYIVYYNPVLKKLLSDPKRFVLIENIKRVSIYRMVL
ncbi:MAG: class I SAM-dependent methyltransferase [Pseudomonadota bacterium]